MAGYAEAEALLRQLDAETTTDPETIGLWSAIHKRRAEMATRSPDERKQDLTEAIRAAERGFIIKRDYYNGTNLAYLLNMRASLSSGDDKIADNVLASRVRREVVDIATRGLETLAANTAAGADTTTLRDEKYWLAATRAESLIALGDKSGEDLMKEALASAPAAVDGGIHQEPARSRPQTGDSDGPVIHSWPLRHFGSYSVRHWRC